MKPASESDRTWCDLKHFWDDQMRFQNKLKLYLFSRSQINLITTHTNLVGNLSTRHMTLSMIDFQILQSFHVTGKTGPTPKIKPVNTNGATHVSLGFAACGGNFTDSLGAALGCFAINIGIATVLHAEISTTNYSCN